MKSIKFIVLFAIIISAFISTKVNAAQLSEKDIIAATLYYEARSEHEIGIRAVASIIYNRAHEKRWSKLGLSGICIQKKQFSCNNNGVKKPNPKNIKDRQMFILCEKIADEMITGTFKPTHNNNHYVTVKFYKSSKKTHWCKKMKNTVIIKNHIFGTL